MSFGFKNIGHFFATVAADIVKGARAVGGVMMKVGKSETEIETITSLFFPQAVALEREPLHCWDWRRRRCLRPGCRCGERLEHYA